MANPAYCRHAGLPDVVGRTLREVRGELVYADISPRVKQALAGETVAFDLVDTGGWMPGGSELDRKVSAQSEKALADLPKDEAAAKAAWTRAKAAADAKSNPLNNMPRHAAQFSGDPNGDEKAQAAFNTSRLNFLALIFCLMVGTAALPHILMRYYTVPSVKEARQSVTWSLFFIFLLYFTAPALAVLVKYEVFHVLVGTPFDQLPQWVAAWSKVDASLLSVTDINKDNILQLNEMTIGGDIVVLAMPEIAGSAPIPRGCASASGLRRRCCTFRSC